MSPEQFAEISENVRYVRDRVDRLDDRIGHLHVSVEGRLTKMEERASWLGALSGLVGGVLAGLGLHFKGR